MKTENLIDQLSKNLVSVKPLPTTWRRALKLLVSMILGAGLIFSFFSIRHDLRESLNRFQYLGGLGILFLSWLVLTYSLASTQLPTRNKKRHLVIGSVLILILIAVYLTIGFFSPTEVFREGFSKGGFKCSLDIFFLSLVPSGLLVFIMRRAAPTHYIMSGANMALACASFGALLLQFSCPSDDPAHLLLWHLIVPMGVLTLLGIFIGKKFLKW